MSFQVNDSDQQRKLAAKMSLFFGVLIMFAKFFAYRLTGSEAVLSDALESIVNVVAAILVVLTIQYASKPADKDHPYGHGKTEFFSAAFEGGLISFAALFIMVEAGHALVNGHVMNQLGAGALVVFLAGLANALLGLYLLKRGNELQSLALKSSGRHVLSDVLTSGGVLLGLGLVFLTGWTWIDAVVALVLGAFLAYAGWGIVAEAVSGLMDQEDPEILEKIRQSLQPHMSQGIIDIHEMKVIRSGRYHHIDMHLVLPEHWSVTEAHERTHAFEKAVFQDYSFDGEMNYHYDPCRQEFCQVCDLKDCPVRRQPYEWPAKLEQPLVRQSNQS